MAMANNVVGGKQLMTLILFLLLLVVSTTHARHKPDLREMKFFNKAHRTQYQPQSSFPANNNNNNIPDQQPLFSKQTEDEFPHGLSDPQSTNYPFSFNNQYQNTPPQQTRKYQTVQQQYSFDADAAETANKINNVDAYQPLENENEPPPPTVKKPNNAQSSYKTFDRNNDNSFQQENYNNEASAKKEEEDDDDAFFGGKQETYSPPLPQNTVQNQIDAYFRNQRSNTAAAVVAKEQDNDDKLDDEDELVEEDDVDEFLASQNDNSFPLLSPPPKPKPETNFFKREDALNAYLNAVAAAKQQQQHYMAKQENENEINTENDDESEDPADAVFSKTESDSKFDAAYREFVQSQQNGRPPVNQNQPPSPPQPQNYLFRDDETLNNYLNAAAAFANQQETSKVAQTEEEEEEDDLMSEDNDEDSKTPPPPPPPQHLQGNPFSGFPYAFRQGRYEQVTNSQTSNNKQSTIKADDKYAGMFRNDP